MCVTFCPRASRLALLFLAGLNPVTNPADAQTSGPDPGKPPPVRIAPSDAPRQTPAQEKYGLPRNPIVGQPEDVDLSKPLTLERAIRIGLQRQNSIAISRTQSDAASARLVQARAAYFPTIQPSYRYNYNLQPGGLFFVGGQLIAGSTVNENINTNIVASMLLLDSGQREARVGLSRRNLFATEYGLGNERQNVILSVTEAYYSLLRTRALLRVQEQTVARARTNLESIQAQVSVGNAAQADTLQAEADLANAEVNLLQAQVDYDVAQAQLKNAMGVVSYEPIRLASEDVPPPPTDPDASSLEEYVSLAFNNRLDLKQQQERINALGYNVRLARINAGLNIAANLQQGFQMDPNTGETRVFGLSVSYPLFDAGNARAAIHESRANLEAERRTLDQLQQTVRFNVEQAYRTREQARRRYAASLKAVQAAQLNYDAALERQKQGVVNILDVINAQLQLVNAQVSNVQATYDYYIADARLQRAVGLNDPEYRPRVPGANPPKVTLDSGRPVSFFSMLSRDTMDRSMLHSNLSLSSRRSGLLSGREDLLPVAERKP
ncbi:MAG: TolC family protein [Chloroherpetonaceae bacterium]|nr:TolC family protein [Chthonomonadaceae bacterium]MDW8206626.1 TolC family protein [Chloroherpetonaceae bacterium]